MRIFYFLQDEFFAAENAYNETADHFHDVINNFVKPDSL
jgi:hypothetical protein